MESVSPTTALLRRADPWLPWLPLLYLGGLLGLRQWNDGLYRWTLVEDGLLEYATAVAYLLSSLLAFLAARRLRALGRRGLARFWFLAAAGFFLIAGEEVSWGQRILGIETPEAWAAINRQEETTLHNLSFVQKNITHLAYMAVGLGGALAWLLPQFWRGGKPWLSWILPPGRLALWFLPAAVFYLGVEIIHQYTENGVADAVRGLFGGHDPAVRQAWEQAYAALFGTTNKYYFLHQEGFECLLSGGFLVHTLRVWDRAGQAAAGGAAVPAGTERGEGLRRAA